MPHAPPATASAASSMAGTRFLPAILGDTSTPVASVVVAEQPALGVPCSLDQSTGSDQALHDAAAIPAAVESCRIVRLIRCRCLRWTPAAGLHALTVADGPCRRLQCGPRARFHLLSSQFLKHLARRRHNGWTSKAVSAWRRFMILWQAIRRSPPVARGPPS